MMVADVVALSCDFVSDSSGILIGACCSFFLARLVVSLLRNGGVV